MILELRSTIVVDRKLKHPRNLELEIPLTRPRMLALVLYTGCDCNYAMSAAERSGDYETWKWFSFLLGEALLNGRAKTEGAGTFYSGTLRCVTCVP